MENIELDAFVQGAVEKYQNTIPKGVACKKNSGSVNSRSIQNADEVIEYIMDVLHHLSDRKYMENIYLWSGYKRVSISVRDIFFRPGKLKKILASMNKEDLFISFSTYCPSTQTKTVTYDKDGAECSFVKTTHVNAKQSNIFCKPVIALDIDYKKSKSMFIPNDPREFYDYLIEVMEDRIPRPNYIECGNNLRLIYILSEPICVKTDNGKSIYRAAKRIEKHFCEMLNSTLSCNAEPQKEWFRVPGSINRKAGNTVSVEKVCDVEWSIQELLNEYMPALPYDRKTWKKAKRKKNTKKSLESLFEKRIRDFGILAKEPGVPRELLVFFYANTWIRLHGPDNYIEKALLFNSRLLSPLSEKEVISKLRRLGEKTYNLRNDTIMDSLHLSENDCERLGLHLGRSVKESGYKKRLEKVRINKELFSTIRDRYISGESASSIRDDLGISMNFVRTSIAKIRLAMTKEEKSLVIRNRKSYFLQKKKAKVIAKKIASYVKKKFAATCSLVASFDNFVGTCDYYPESAVFVPPN